MKDESSILDVLVWLNWTQTRSDPRRFFTAENFSMFSKCDQDVQKASTNVVKPYLMNSRSNPAIKTG